MIFFHGMGCLLREEIYHFNVLKRFLCERTPNSVNFNQDTYTHCPASGVMCLHHFSLIFKSDGFSNFLKIYKESEWETVQILISRLHMKPADQDLHVAIIGFLLILQGE